MHACRFPSVDWVRVACLEAEFEAAQRIVSLDQVLASVGLGTRRDCVRRKVHAISKSRGQCIADYHQGDDRLRNLEALCCGSTS